MISEAIPCAVIRNPLCPSVLCWPHRPFPSRQANHSSICRQVPTLSIVLLTHATVAHLGAYAHCCKHFPLFTRIPIYATTPVISLGRTLLQDLYASTPLAATIIPPASLSEASYSYNQVPNSDASHI